MLFILLYFIKKIFSANYILKFIHAIQTLPNKKSFSFIEIIKKYKQPIKILKNNKQNKL